MYVTIFRFAAGDELRVKNTGKGVPQDRLRGPPSLLEDLRQCAVKAMSFYLQ